MTDTNKHYERAIQPIEYIQCTLNDLPVTPFEGACIKDIIKYSSRYGLKDNKVKEAKKILDYAFWLLLESAGFKVKPEHYNHTEILKRFGIVEEKGVKGE